jgi:glycosyltransferase involved in cell wall biosynthesis
VSGASPEPEPLVAVAMATHEPRDDLFEHQIGSLRAQTHSNWLCVISDDASSPERFSAIERAVGDDVRFEVSRSDSRLGFYRNFERALERIPADAKFVAFADQDDRWRPDKLAALAREIGDARLVYSDARAVRSDGSVLAETLWRERRNNLTDLASLLFANSVTGAAAMFRRDLLDLALPFPEAPGKPYHDHWVALVARGAGRLAYIDRPLLDYIQHSGAVLGADAIAARPALGRRARLRRLARDPTAARERWREAYEQEWLRVEAFARALLVRCGDRLGPDDRRVLERVTAGERSPRTWAWLAMRPLRSVAGRNETKGFEHRLLRGLVWRRLTSRHEGQAAG